jgi:cytochrome c-type biogenesis protein
MDRMVALLFALLAGIVTIAAPCTLPVLPILVGTSFGGSNSWRPVAMALGFIATFAAITLVFHFVTSILGLDADTLRSLAIGLLAVFGILLLWPKLYERISPSIAAVTGAMPSPAAGSRDGILGGFVLGTTLGLVWTPCAGPVLGSILTLLATQANPVWAALLLVAYACGAAIPMMAIGYGGQYAVRHVRRIGPFTHRLQQLFGVLVLCMAGAMFFQYDTAITAWLSSLYPSGQTGL